MKTALFILIGVACVAALALVLRRPSRHQRAVRDVLDAPDALEDRLRTARDEIQALAGERDQDPVRDAMREMLRQRLWLRDHGRNATVAELTEVRASIDAARDRIDDQLVRIAQARAPAV